MSNISDLRQECWTKRLYAFGTAKIFERRASRLNKKRNVIIFLGLLSPVGVGAYAAAFTLDSQVLKFTVLPLAGLIAVIQAAFSLWSLVSGWDNDYQYSAGSLKANTRLASQFEQLATADDDELSAGIAKVRQAYERQDEDDSARHISTKEKRFGYRAALFQYKTRCPTCAEVPHSMKATKCDSCGNF